MLYGSTEPSPWRQARVLVLLWGEHVGWLMSTGIVPFPSHFPSNNLVMGRVLFSSAKAGEGWDVIRNLAKKIEPLCFLLATFTHLLVTSPFPSFLIGLQKKEGALAIPMVEAATPFTAWIGPPMPTRKVLRGQVKSQRRSPKPLRKEQVKRERPCHSLNWVMEVSVLLISFFKGISHCDWLQVRVIQSNVMLNIRSDYFPFTQTKNFSVSK